MSSRRSNYDSLEVSELFCPRCRTARRVRQHLLLVLPDGNRYEYRCEVCGEAVGAKQDDDRSTFQKILSLK